MASSIMSLWGEPQSSKAAEKAIAAGLISRPQKPSLEAALKTGTAKSVIQLSPTKPSSVESGTVTLIAEVIDDSESIAYHKLEKEIIDGENNFLDELSKLAREHGKEILLMRRLLNGGLIHGFQRVEECKPLGLADLTCSGMTPWYGAMGDCLAASINYGKELCLQNRQVQLLIGTVTDGEATDQPDQATLSLFNDPMLRGTTPSGRKIFSAVGISPFASARETFERLGLETYASGSIKDSILAMSKILVSKSKTFGQEVANRPVGGEFVE